MTRISILSPRWRHLFAGGAIALAALLAYANSFSVPFIFDDRDAVTDNPALRRFENVLSPAADSIVGGRPLVNLSFAVNYALGGTQVWGYHAFNLAIHILAALTLFGIARRTLERWSALTPTRCSTAPAQRVGVNALHPTTLALAIALLWAVHPLQTEAVTYITQRAETMMGLFYLLTLYFFIRATDKGFPVGKPVAWLDIRFYVFSIFSCFLGTLSKEVIATAPVLVLLYDCTFVAGTFRAAWRARWRYYLGLASSWLLLGRLMVGLNHRGAGFGQGVTPWTYALTSCRSVATYLRLAAWPHPLVFDYGTGMVYHPLEVLPEALALAAVLGATVIALCRRPLVGFAGAWFFIILAPASSVVPLIGQPMAEHRMYLSLAALIGLGVVGLHALIGRGSLIVFAAIAVGLGGLSFRRNGDYRTALALWTDTLAKQPHNGRGHNDLGAVLVTIPGRLADGIAEYRMALKSDPDYADAHNNLGVALATDPAHLNEAMAQFQAALKIDPRYAPAHYNLGVAWMRTPGHLTDAIAEFQTALQIKPDYLHAHNSMGLALMRIPGRMPEAIAEFQAALKIDPHDFRFHFNLGVALAKDKGRIPEAIAEFETALRINPDLFQARQIIGQLRAKE